MSSGKGSPQAELKGWTCHQKKGQPNAAPTVSEIMDLMDRQIAVKLCRTIEQQNNIAFLASVTLTTLIYGL